MFLRSKAKFIKMCFYQTELIDPAVKGTIDVLDTCRKISSVKRVILTSSMAAVLIRQPPLEPNDVVDETFFSDSSVCIESKVLWILFLHVSFESLDYISLTQFVFLFSSGINSPKHWQRM